MKRQKEKLHRNRTTSLSKYDVPVYGCLLCKGKRGRPRSLLGQKKAHNHIETDHSGELPDEYFTKWTKTHRRKFIKDNEFLKFVGFYRRTPKWAE